MREMAAMLSSVSSLECLGVTDGVTAIFPTTRGLRAHQDAQKSAKKKQQKSTTKSAN